MTITTQEPTPESVWAFLQETARQMKESDRQMKETIKEIMQETDRQMQETDRRMKETDRQIQETSREIKEAKDLFTTQWGRLVESLVDGSLVRLFNQRGIAVEDTSTRIKGSRQGHSYEFDIIAHNGREIIIVEVKTTLRPNDVRVFLGKLKNAKNWMPRYGDNIIHGAMAWLQANAGAERMAANNGLFSIRAVGDSAIVTNEPDFEPKPF
uniref:Holliday junction resolvase (Hjc) n=3 Tax=Candidatus Kentrum sp. FM TaxID=2126340 RepID=A0A450VTC7_9GAMM|nr:MAG: holliday junction resolvase (hjc) [Candidatus Kentron sp. FM]